MPATPRRKGRPKAFYETSRPARVQALDRALDVLDTLSLHAGLTLTEIADTLSQSPATIYRALATLQARGMVETDAATQTWHIGPMAFRMGSAFLRRSGVIERSRPVMRQLMEDTGETSNVGIEANGAVMFLSQVETPETIRAFFPPGTVSPMHASGIGKALLSRFSDQRLARYCRAHRLEAFTAKTLTSAETLAADLAAARARGWAYDDEEKTTGMRCVAAPILDVYGEGEAVAGISVSGPTHRMRDARIEAIAAQVRTAAESVSKSLGAPDG